MKFPLPRPLFPGLTITPTDENEYVELVEAFVDKLITQERAFRVTNNADIDTTTWKLAKQTANASVYHSSAPAPASLSASRDGDAAARRLIPFLVVGKVPSTLEDLAYNFTTPTRESALTHGAYLNSNIADVDILHSVRRPTAKEPWAHVSIKWTVMTPLSAIMTPRDYVFIDALGMRVDPHTGERVCYRFAHSIPLAGAGPMTDRGFVRSDLSLATLFREDPSNRSHSLEYARAFFVGGGAVPHSVFTSLVALLVSKTASQGQVSEYKKLALALRLKEVNKWTVTAPASPVATQRNECAMCAASLNMINKSRRDCALCNRRLCVLCRVRKDLCFLSAEREVEKVRVTFCACCIQQAIKFSPREAATEEFVMRHDELYRMPASLR